MLLIFRLSFSFQSQSDDKLDNGIDDTINAQGHSSKPITPKHESKGINFYTLLTYRYLTRMHVFSV